MSQAQEQEQVTVSVIVMGKKYHIMCPVLQEENLLQAAKCLDEKMRAAKEKNSMRSDDSIAVITALNIVHEKLVFDQMHQRLQDESKEQVKKVEYLTMQLENALEEHI